MNIKGLLLGSAAALVAVSGARAADAVVYEAEPMEYVKVCDAYGAGFYYIPGTDTCLQISGEVYFQVGATNDRGVVHTPNYYANNFGDYNAFSRARLNIDARSDTEWGTLRGFIRLNAEWNAQNQILTAFDAAGAPIGTTNLGTDGNAMIDQAFLELGGFRMGYTESAWVDAKDGGVANWGSHSDWGMSYAYQQRQLISYSFKSNGFVGVLSLEDDGNSNYMPDVVALVGYEGAWGGVWAKVAYDEDIAPASAAWLGARAAGLSGVDGIAASLGMQYNIGSAGSNLRVIGYYAENANAYSVGSEWSVMASYNHVFSDKFSASLAAQYMADTDYAVPGSPDAFQVEVEGVWTPVTNFQVRGGIGYAKADGLKGSTSGFVRFTRFF